MNEYKNNEFTSKIQHLDLAFHPIVIVNETGHTVKAYEILLRYRDGNLFPFEIFEELIASEESCDVLNEWYEQKISFYLQAHPHTQFSLNVDLQQMLYPSTWEMLKHVSQYSQRLVIELTEFYEVTTEEYQSIFPKAMNYIRNLGMKIAFDDVGNGQHSLAFVTKNIGYVNSIKLSLLHFSHIDRETMSLYLDVWVRVAKEFNVSFIVEAVEEESMAKMLLEKGIICQQGYYWSKPLSAIELK